MADKTANPFTPVFGKVPAYMAGRSELLDELSVALDSNGNDPAIVSLIVGARGTGKTALLGVTAEMAQQDGWIVTKVTSGPGMLDELLSRIERAASHLLEEPPKRKLKSVGLPGVATVEWENVSSPVTDWRLRVEGVLNQIGAAGAGLLVTVDEVDAELNEMTTLVTAFQHFLDDGRRVSLVMAGLPYGLSALLSGKTTSFLRRAARFDLGPIGDSEIEEALRITMARGGKTIEEEAVVSAVEAISGFPYMLQLVGYRAWNISANRDCVTAADVDCAIKIAQRELDERVYEATYYELTNADRAFLEAMLPDAGVTLQADIGKRLGKASGHVSKYKKRMLQEGIIQERVKGCLEFCLPGFRDYLLRRRA